MKKQLIALAAAAAILLSGCSSLLDRDYSYVTAHNTTPTAAEGDPSILRAENYQELVNALVYFVAQGTQEGTVRLYGEWEDVEADLDAACLEVVQEDPLGAYAVEYMKYSVTSVVTYYEADIQPTYRRSREQVDSIVSATGTTAIRNELESALANFASEQVLRISYFNEDENYIRTLCQEAYCATPATALDMPEVEVAIYPDSGQQRIVEILLTYHLDQQELARRSDLVRQAAADMASGLSRTGARRRCSERPRRCWRRAATTRRAERPHTMPCWRGAGTARAFRWPLRWFARRWERSAWWCPDFWANSPIIGRWYPLRRGGAIWISPAWTAQRTHFWWTARWKRPVSAGTRALSPDAVRRRERPENGQCACGGRR